MEGQPIKYSDLLQDDGAIDKAIEQLKEFAALYESLRDKVKSHAKEISSAIKTVTVTTEENKATIKKSTEETTKLSRLQNDLAEAYSTIGAKIAELKLRLADKNKELSNEAAAVVYASDSYKELKASLALAVDSYKKLTKEQALNSSEGRQLTAEILKYKAAIKQLDDAVKLQTRTTNNNRAANAANKTQLTELEKAKRKLVFATSDENEQLINLAVRTKEVNEIAKLNVIIAREQEGSYNRLSAQYALNKIYLNKMSEAERTTTESGKKLVQETNELYNSMIRLQEATGNHRLSVGNYKKAWDGVGMGVNQIVRELPVLGISMNTFFLAISNNIPILIDEIQKVRAANAAAAAAGEKTTNIYKSITSALFGWNTALVVLMTVFSRYGQDIIDFIFKTDKAAKAIEKLKTSTEYYNEAVNDGKKDSQEELVRLNLLYAATQKLEKPYSERIRAAQELRKLYPKYLQFLSDEQILAGKAALAYDVLAASIQKAARSRAFEDKIIENEKERIDLNDKRIGQLALMALKDKEILAAEKQLADANSKPDGDIAKSFIGTYQNTVKDLEKQRNNLANEYFNILGQIKEIDNANERLAKSINIGDLDLEIDDKKATKKDKSKKDRTEEIAKKNLEIEKQYAESLTELIDDELFKQKQIYKDTYAAESAELMNKYNHDKDLTERSRDLILEIVKNYRTKLGEDTTDIETEIALRALSVEEQMLQDRLDMTKEGSIEEANIKLQMMENSKKIEILENSKLTELEKKSELEIVKKWDTLIDSERKKSIYELTMYKFDLQQAYEESEFDLLKRTEFEKTKFKLEQEKRRWLKILELAKAGNSELSDIEIKTIENRVNAINTELSGLTEKVDFYSMFGLRPTDEQREAANEVISTTVQYLREALDAEIAMADAAIQKSEERVNAKKSALDAEIEARNNGYAFNVAMAKKEYDEEQKILLKAKKDKEALVRAQTALDTVAQTSSLITAAANIWAAFSKLGPLGVGLAIGGIGLMFGSFLTAKVKAASLSKQAVEYGEGGFEKLEGGSHASGNDINIGTMPDGRERRAEGGEGLAIIPKSSMQKYGALVPKVINSIIKGAFERDFANTFVSPDTMQVNNIILDSRLGDDVAEIRKQGEEKYLLNSNGKLIRRYKNLLTTYN